MTDILGGLYFEPFTFGESKNEQQTILLALHTVCTTHKLTQTYPNTLHDLYLRNLLGPSYPAMKRPRPPQDPSDLADSEELASDIANTINLRACRELGVSEAFLKEWGDGVILEGSQNAEPFFFDDYPTLKDNAAIAAKELDRLTEKQKIFWYPEGVAPPDLSVCPGNLILNGSRPRVVQDWTKAGLNKLLTNPEVNYGTMDSFLRLLRPKGFMAGLDFQDCFFHWKVHHTSRKWLGVRHPVTKRLGVFLFVPFGLGPAPGINDRNVAEVMRVASIHLPDVEGVVFVDDLRLFNSPDPQRTEQEDKELLTFRLIEYKELCEQLGMQVHTKAGKLIWPTQTIDWLGWIVDSVNMIIIMSNSKAEKGKTQVSEFIVMIRDGTPILAKQAMSLWGFLNFISNVIKQAQPFARELGRCIVEAQVFQAWSAGKKNFNPPIKFTKMAVDDLEWWLKLFITRPHRKIHHLDNISFIWHSKLPNLQAVRKEAWDKGILLILGLDASSKIGWGITLGDTFLQGRWEGEDIEKHINWKELKTYEIALNKLSHLLINRIVYVKSDNAAALHYINSGRGRIAELALIARSIRLKEAQLAIESVAIHIPGKINITPDALSRYFFDVSFRDKNPDRTLRKRLFQGIERLVGNFTIDGMAADDGHNKLVPTFGSPSNPLFELQLEGQNLWVFPPLELIGITLKFLIDHHKTGCNFSCCILVPDRTSAPWYRYLTKFKPVRVFQIGSDMFRSRVDESFVKVPPVKERWRVMRSQ